MVGVADASSGASKQWWLSAGAAPDRSRNGREDRGAGERNGELARGGSRPEAQHPRRDRAADGIDHVAQCAAGRVEAVRHRVELVGGNGGVSAYGFAVGSGSAEPAAHGRGRQVDACGDSAVSEPAGGAKQASTDGLNAVSAPRMLAA